ncbi:nuclear receptor coactivator 3 isoform X3 [Anthonomus grandis grandis]|uniref:nuclear receptor coactivator 3 isoform X3 n=3 Tax=Anthonomus grandis grandis TaxID=2921223 RepID=UPI002165263B|nr:nuclear receptor coactivator 3 isoform X3 [Anthonomus grandis grandis]
MLDHTSAMYLNVTPPYEDDASFFPDFYSRVGSCELQDPSWSKMNSVSGHKQKRKKSDNKPQTQINKCNNEKRRREQENIYIEELAELISANFADMSSLSVKPDKCAILQETVNQIRRIKQQDIASHHNSDPVQQGEVSSSRPTILSNDIYGPLLLEALEGFLFVINSEGKVEHVTENVSNYIKYTKEEIIGKAIYNFMHLGDHAKFHSNLLPMTIEWGGSTEQPPPARSKSIDVRLLVKADDLDETVEEKNQRVPFYELMHISSTQLRDTISVSSGGDADDVDETEEEGGLGGGGGGGPCVLCVASRISHRDKASCYFEQFTTKLDTSGKIIGVDTSGVTSECVAQALRKDFKGRVLRDLVPSQDAPKVTQHLKETLGAGTSISAVYRIQIMPDKLVPVQTKSKFFKTNPHGTSDADFIMATHSIIGDNDTLDPGGGIGGPLMTSIVNGAGTSSSSSSSRNGPSTASSDSAPPSTSSTSTGGGGGNAMQVQTAPAGAFTPEFLENDFPSLEFSSATWDLETGWPTETTTTRPSSRQTVSTPSSRPPSNPPYSNAPTMVQSPLAHYSSQPSPVNQHHQQQQQQNQQNSTTAGNFMQHFSVLDYQEQHAAVFGGTIEEPKDTKTKEDSTPHVEPQRLRSLLTNPPTSSSSSSSSGGGGNQSQDDNRDRILKELLNQKDDDHGLKSESGKIGRLIGVRGTMQDVPKASSSTGNNMLRELLNDKNDDDEIETKAGMKKGSELLQELLKKKDHDEDDDKKNGNTPHEDALLKTLGFPTSAPNDRRGAKRSIDDSKDGGDHRQGGKRNMSGAHHVSSSGSSEKSEIYQKNRMLALLLENPTPPPPAIPPLPASIISATPQEKLPRVITDPSKVMGSSMTGGANVRTIGSHKYNAARQQQNHFGNNNTNKPITNFYPSSTSGGGGGNENSGHIWSDNNNIQGFSDPDLSALLDDVIDFVPDHNILPILESSHEHFSQPNNQATNQMSEKNAIKNIQKLLEQCEKSVPSPNVSLPARPPAYSVANISSGQQNSMGYHPPPNYPQGKYPRALSGGRASQFTNSNLTVQQQQLLEQQRKMQQQRQAEEQKRRLLQLQERQQLLIPSNATAAELNSIQNIDNLLNNTVAPNVTLQRSNSVPQESQLSPGYTNQLTQQATHQRNQQQQQQPPFSPQMPSPLGVQQSPNFQQQRMSPQSQFAAQLSPRLSFPGEQQSQQQQQGGGGAAPQGPNTNWASQQRLTAQNPMLNAQLTGSLPRGASFQRSPGGQQRSLSSPGGGGGAGGGPRHSPFNEQQQFASPSSPNATYSQTQYLQRLQRANSVPTSNPQLSGSPRLYHGNAGPLSYPPQNHPHQSAPPSPMMYPPALHHPHQQQQQQDSSPFNSSYNDQQTPQMNVYERRGSTPSQTGSSSGGGGNTGNPTSEFVRQELRAVVGARTAQGAGPRPTASDSSAAPQLQQLAQQGNVDLEALGISFEMPPGARGESPKLWGAIGSEMASVSPQPQATTRTIMEEGRQGDQHSKTSLLQQLLSDQSK